MESHDLAIPIYLDTNTLLDLLASIEGGFSIVERITTRSADSKATELSGEAGFGIANVLNLFKIDLKGSAAKTVGKQTGEERQTERYHTYGSLLNRLRSNLVESRLVKEIVDENSWNDIAASDFVEARGKFIPNPLSASLQTMNRLLGMISLFGGLDFTIRGKSPQQKREAQQQSRQFQDMRKFFEGVMKDLQHENIQTYVVELTTLPNYRIVISLFTEYLRDRSGTELPYGEFRVLGKVIINIKEGESVDLLRGSALSGLSEEILSPLLNGFREAGEKGIKIPDLITKIEAPAIQVIPISVYV